MITKAVRIYGRNDLRLEEFELPPPGEDEILAKVVCDTICMSSHKAALQGSDHKRVPDDVAVNPTIIGHEFTGVLLEAGAKWKHKYETGAKFAIQPALNYKGSQDAPGYSYRYIGGDATYIVIPNEVMEMDCLLPYNGDAFFYASLSEPMSCIIGAFHASYHTTQGCYAHDMGIKPGGNMALLAGAGPMGIGAVDYAVNRCIKPGLLVVTDIDETRLERARQILPPEVAERKGVTLRYLNTSDAGHLLALTNGHGYDDVFVFAPVAPVVELGDRLLAKDGCLNFFAGPTSKDFSAKLNFYNVHYSSAHIAGTSGGNTDDMREALQMMEKGLINPASMITHVGGLDSVRDTTLNLDKIPGGKKLIYTHICMPLTAIDDFGKSRDARLRGIDEIIKGNNGLWCYDAERALLEAFK